MGFTTQTLSHRNEELAALASEVADLRRLDSCSTSDKKFLQVLEQRAKGSNGIVNRAIRTHIHRLNLLELLSAKSGEARLQGLLCLSEAMQKVVDEDDAQSQAPRSTASRLLLAIVCKEAVVDGNSHNRQKLLWRFTGLMRHMQMQLSNSSSQWVDPEDEWVVTLGDKHAIKAEKVEGDSAEERIFSRWEVMAAAFKFAQTVALDGLTGKGRVGNSEQVSWDEVLL